MTVVYCVDGLVPTNALCLCDDEIVSLGVWYPSNFRNSAEN